jgi:hypothetical protein
LPAAQSNCGFGRRGLHITRKVNPTTADLAKAQAELDDWRVVLETRSIDRTETGHRLRAASYDGHWAGQLNCTGAESHLSPFPCQFGLELDFAGATMSAAFIEKLKAGDSRTEFEAGKFHVSGQSTHRFAWAQQSESDDDGEVVEGWTLAMTLKDTDHLVVYWTRIVNNVDVAPDDKDSKWAEFAAGELVRTH